MFYERLSNNRAALALSAMLFNTWDVTRISALYVLSCASHVRVSGQSLLIAIDRDFLPEDFSFLPFPVDTTPHSRVVSVRVPVSAYYVR